VGATPCFTPSTCSCFNRRVHFVAPSISSRFRSLFLNASSDRNYWYTEGVLSFSDGSPVLLSRCFAPTAAWSCFSTDCTFSVSFFISSYGAIGYSFLGYGCVDVSFNWSTMPSTSYNRSSIAFYCFSIVWTVFSTCMIWDGAAFDLVSRWLVVSSWFALSSILVILSTRSSITFSRWSIFASWSLFRIS
jgi:hypothetical protein